jgi:uncharacterized membrane protein YesL
VSGAGRLLFSWLEDAYFDFGKLLVYNLLWFALTLPLVTAPPAAAGLYFAVRQLANQQPADWRTFFEGFREHFWLSWRWGLLNLIVLAGLAANLWFYGLVEAEWGLWAQAGFMALLALWCLLQVYTFPLLLEQHDRRLRVALRNSIVFYLRRPGLSLGLALIIALLAAISLVLVPPAWLVLTGSLCAYLATRGTLHLAGELSETPV